MFVVEEVRSESQFRALQVEWDNLVEGNGQYSPFLTHDWFHCCLASYSAGKDVFILVVRDGPEVSGIAPLWHYKDTVRNIRVRKIGFITSPDSPLVDFALRKGKEEDVLKSILSHLLTERRDAWDILTLSQWPIESASYKMFRCLLGEREKKCYTGLSSVTPYIPIRGEWKEFLQSMSTRFRKTHRNIANRVRKLPNVEIQWFRQDGSGFVLRDILTVSEKSWKKKEGFAITSRDESRSFFEKLTNIAGERGWLLVWLLKTDGVPIAMEYDLEHAGRVYAVRADFDEAYREYSPGAYLEYEIVRFLFENGYKEYNTGPGMNAYKLHWTDEFKENAAMNIFNNSLKGLTIWGLENKIIPLLKRVRDLRGVTKNQ